MDQELAQSRDETRQLEEDNSAQLQALEELDRQSAIVKAELRLVHKHSEELSASLESERERATEERRHWTAELREMRRLMERQGVLLERLSASPPAGEVAGCTSGTAEGVTATDELTDQADIGARAAELRQRANSRRAAQQRRSS